MQTIRQNKDDCTSFPYILTNLLPKSESISSYQGFLQ